MLVVRKQQIEALDDAAFEGFEKHVIEHVKESFPKHSELLGDEGVASVVKSALEKARSHGLSSEGGMQLYVDLTFLLGAGFHADPQIPWAGEILKDSKPEDARLDRLFDKAMAYLERVSGPENEHIDEAQRRIRQESTRDLPPTAAADFENYMLGRLNWIWPQKCDDAGEEALRKVIRDSIASAQKYDLATSRGVLSLIGLKFLLGNGVETDPQFPWVTEILTSKEIQKRHERADRLLEAAVAYLDKWCG